MSLSLTVDPSPRRNACLPVHADCSGYVGQPVGTFHTGSVDRKRDTCRGAVRGSTGSFSDEGGSAVFAATRGPETTRWSHVVLRLASPQAPLVHEPQVGF